MTLNDSEVGGRACYCLAAHFSGLVNSISTRTLPRLCVDGIS